MTPESKGNASIHKGPKTIEANQSTCFHASVGIGNHVTSDSKLINSYVILPV